MLIDAFWTVVNKPLKKIFDTTFNENIKNY